MEYIYLHHSGKYLKLVRNIKYGELRVSTTLGYLLVRAAAAAVVVPIHLATTVCIDVQFLFR